VRTADQVAAIRNAVAAIHHVHLTADARELERRFRDREPEDIVEAPTLESATGHTIEEQAGGLGAIADHRIDTTQMAPEAVVVALLEMGGGRRL
jgi:hypothetical protein